MCSCVHVCAWCGGGVAVVWRSKKAFITLCSPVVPLLSTSKADSGLASEFRWDRAIYTASHFPDGSIPAPTGAVDRPGSEGNLTTPATSPSRQTELEPHQTGEAIWLKRGDTAVD